MEYGIRKLGFYPKRKKYETIKMQIDLYQPNDIMIVLMHVIIYVYLYDLRCIVPVLHAYINRFFVPH